MRKQAVERLVRWGPAFIGAVVVRLAYWAFVTPEWVPNADADQYVELSRSLADGRGFGLMFPELAHHPTAFRPPFYPFLLTPGALLFDHALWPARLLNVVLGSLVVVLAGVLAARIAGRTAGWCTAAVAAVYPPLLANDTVTLTEPLALLLLLAAILLLDDRRWVPAGVVTGLILLTRPNGYLVLAVLALWCWRRIDLRRAAGLVAVAMLVFVPWLVRNQIQVGTWRPTTSDGFTMAAIYAKPAQRAGTFTDPAYSSAYDDVEHRLARLDEPTWNRVLTQDAIDGVRHNPRYISHTVRRNFRGYFEIDAYLNRYADVNDGRNLDFNEAVRPILYLVSLVGLAGLVLHRRDERVIVLSVAVAQFVVLSLLLVAPPRLRAPFDLACAIGTGLVIAAVLDRRSAGRGPDADEAEAPSEPMAPVGS